MGTWMTVGILSQEVAAAVAVEAGVAAVAYP